jgi:23S rRNA (uridine2552-2'-O)-methyltransferase
MRTYYNIIFLQSTYTYDRDNSMKVNRWDDHYARRARDEKWLARSVYKLQEIDRRFKVINRGNRLLDLGCYPGSWSQYGTRKVGPEGEVVGLDLVRPDRFSAANFRYIQADALALDLESLSREIGPVDVVMSDLAPRTTGIRLTDESRSIALAGRAFQIALRLLKVRGNFICKVFEGTALVAFRSEVSPHFRELRSFRPPAVRKRSREIYLVGLGRVGSLSRRDDGLTG